MERKRINSSRIRSAGYDPAKQILEIEFANNQVWHYWRISEEVQRRFMSSPNAAKFFEDQIEDEYSSKRA